MHALPLAADIMHARPEATVDWLVEENFAAIPSMNRYVVGVQRVALRRWRRRPFDTAVWREVRVAKGALRDARYDLVLDVQGLAKSAWLARWTRAPIAGFDSSTVRERIATHFYQRRFDVPGRLHAVERCRLLGSLALDYTVNGAPQFGLEPRSAPHALQGARLAVLLVNASRSTKLWGDDRWLVVERWLAEQNIASVLLWGAPAERRRTESLVARMQRATVLPLSPLDTIASTFLTASIVIGLDTGLTHLAAAIGRPAVGIYCDYDPSLVGLVGGAQAGNAVASIGSATAAPSAGEVIEAAGRVLSRSA